MTSETLSLLLNPNNSNIIVNMSKNDLLEFAGILLNNKQSKSCCWMDVKQVAQEFGLSINKVKSAKWRKENNFPTHQPGGAGCKVTFLRYEIEEWLKKY